MHTSSVSLRYLLFGLSFFLLTSVQSEALVEDAPARLVVTLVEYRADIVPARNASSSEIVEELLKGDIQPLRTIRMPVIVECESLFQISERIRLPQQTSAGQAENDEPGFAEIGTMFRVIAKRTAASVLMQFDYTTSRLTNDDTTKPGPGVKKTMLQGTYSFRIGEPVLVGGVTARDGFYLIATVTEPTP